MRTGNDEEKTAEFASNVVRIHIVKKEVEREKGRVRAALMKVKQYISFHFIHHVSADQYIVQVVKINRLISKFA